MRPDHPPRTIPCDANNRASPRKLLAENTFHKDAVQVEPSFLSLARAWLTPLEDKPARLAKFSTLMKQLPPVANARSIITRWSCTAAGGGWPKAAALVTTSSSHSFCSGVIGRWADPDFRDFARCGKTSSVRRRRRLAPPESGGARSEYHAVVGKVSASMLAHASAGVR